jgi:hypothetical protein
MRGPSCHEAGLTDLPLDLAELENQRVLTLIDGK